MPGPDERPRVVVVAVDDAADVGNEFGDTSKGTLFERFARLDREPYFNLVKPGGASGRVTKMHVRMPRRLQIWLRFVRGRVVEDQLWIFVPDTASPAVHEVEKPPAVLDVCSAALADVTFSYSTRSAAC
jgi:hypothetical protein